MNLNKVKVWDLYIRTYHWALVILVFLNYFVTEEGDPPHRYIGYAAVVLVLLRIVWGFVGSPYARFSQFWPTPHKVQTYMKSLLQNNPPRMLGHNPLAAIMMIFLLTLILLIGLTGWMIDLDLFWGADWVEESHELLANTLMIAVLLHAMAATIESLRHRENLIVSMFHGFKRKEE